MSKPCNALCHLQYTASPRLLSKMALKYLSLFVNEIFYKSISQHYLRSSMKPHTANAISLVDVESLFSAPLFIE